MSRDLAIIGAKSNPSHALGLARKVPNPWRRAEALAWACRFGPAEAVADVARESIRAAQACSDCYQQVAVMAWPIRALIERGAIEPALATATEALSGLGRVEPLSSRSEAAFLLFQATFDLPGGTREQLASTLVGIASRDTHWRTHRNAVDAIIMLRPAALDLAERLTASLPQEKLRAKIARRVSEHDTMTPRRFFW